MLIFKLPGYLIPFSSYYRLIENAQDTWDRFVTLSARELLFSATTIPTFQLYGPFWVDCVPSAIHGTKQLSFKLSLLHVVILSPPLHTVADEALDFLCFWCVGPVLTIVTTIIFKTQNPCSGNCICNFHNCLFIITSWTGHPWEFVCCLYTKLFNKEHKTMWFLQT